MNGKQTVMQYRFIIQVNCPGQKLDMSAIRALFEGTGVELNSGYGPIVINPKLGRHVVRGRATPEAKAKAERILGIRFFADAKSEIHFPKTADNLTERFVGKDRSSS